MSEPERLPEEHAAEQVPLPKPTDPPPEGVAPPPPPAPEQPEMMTRMPAPQQVKMGKQGEPIIMPLGDPEPPPSPKYTFLDSKVATQFIDAGIPLQHGVPDNPDEILAAARKANK
jgi:hypothetical protein